MICASAFIHAAEVTPANSQLNFLPWPKSVDVATGRVHIGDASRIVVLNEELKPLAEILRDEFRSVSGINTTVATAPARNGDIVLAINKKLKAGEDVLSVRKGEVVRSRDGAYRLVVKDGVYVEGFDYRAVAEGTATLLHPADHRGHLLVCDVGVAAFWTEHSWRATLPSWARVLS